MRNKSLLQRLILINPEIKLRMLHSPKIKLAPKLFRGEFLFYMISFTFLAFAVVSWQFARTLFNLNLVCGRQPGEAGSSCDNQHGLIT